MNVLQTNLRIAAFGGPSGSGKTTLISGLIRRYRSEGRSVAVIKHTHHPIDGAPRGDTEIFRRSGADPVILAGDGLASLYTGCDEKQLMFSSPGELLFHIETGILLIEGFREWVGIPRLTLDASFYREPGDVAAILDRIWTEGGSHCTI